MRRQFGCRMGGLVRLFCLLGFLLFVSSGAQAASYDDFSRGVAANNRGDSDLAIAALTSALNAGDLNSSLIPTAYLDRGVAHLRKGECKDAVGDLSTAIKLKPDSIDAYSWRAAAHACAGEKDEASADLDILIAKQPGANAYRARGKLHWFDGDFAAAAADFQQAAALSPASPYIVLWLEMSRLRTGTFDPAKAKHDIRSLDSDNWPMPVFDLYSGKTKTDDVMAAALNGDSATPVGRQCEARFYIAEWWIANHNPGTAKPLLEQAKATCPRDYEEYPAVMTELNQLQ
jgi:lipoprotein NlpI